MQTRETTRGDERSAFALPIAGAGAVITALAFSLFLYVATMNVAPHHHVPWELVWYRMSFGTLVYLMFGYSWFRWIKAIGGSAPSNTRTVIIVSIVAGILVNVVFANLGHP